MLKSAALSLFLIGSFSAKCAEHVVTDRYTVVRLAPEKYQVEPLTAVIQVKFPGQILSAEQAVHYILDESGYELVERSIWTPEMVIMLGNNLPLVQRDLTKTPMTVIDVLGVIAGPAFNVIRDPLRRKISFELKAEYRGLIDG